MRPAELVPLRFRGRQNCIGVGMVTTMFTKINFEPTKLRDVLLHDGCVLWHRKIFWRFGRELRAFRTGEYAGAKCDFFSRCDRRLSGLVAVVVCRAKGSCLPFGFVRDVSSDLLECEADVGNRLVNGNCFIAHRYALYDRVFGSMREIVFKL